MSLKWSNVNIEVLNKNKKIKSKYIDIVKNASGEVSPGEIYAIMGPSGGGKTTLLNALAGRIPPGSYTQGHITYNNRSRRKQEWLKMIGVVDQDDIVHEDLTIEQTLRYAAMFRLKKRNINKRLEGIGSINTNETKQKENEILDFTISELKLDISSDSIKTSSDYVSEQKKMLSSYECVKEKALSSLDNCIYADETISTVLINKIVNQIIKDLKLENVQENEMSKVSGGERKRVMIGIELVTDPQIIFLDEPTSGLDTLTALKIIKILKNLAVNNNKIVILTIHQPSQEIFYMFDKLLLLSEGNSIYSGLIKDAEKFFEAKKMKKRPQITFPEFIVEICSEDFKLENPSLFYCESSVFKEQPLQKNTNVRKIKNDFYLTFLPSLNHTLILLSRKFKIDANRKTKFMKSQLSKMIAYFLAIFLQVFLYNVSTTNPGLFAMGLEMIAKQSPTLFSAISMVMLKFTFLSITLFIVFFLQISTVIPSFYDEIPLVKREVAVGSYSTGSYLVSLLLYNIIVESILPLISFCLVLYLIPITDAYIFIAFMFTSLFTIPFALCIGSISTTKQFVLILSSIFSSIASIPPSTISSMSSKFGINRDGTKNILSKLTYLCGLITPYYYVSLLSYFSCSSSLDDIKEVTTADFLLNMVENIMQQQISYIDQKQFSIALLFCCTLIAPFLCIFLGIFLLGLNLMPSIRMNLEKKNYDKRA